MKRLILLLIPFTLLSFNCTNPKTELKIDLSIDGQTYNFVKIKDNWLGFRYDVNAQGTTKEIKLEPNENWEEFEFMVDHLEILTLPDQSEISNYQEDIGSNISRKYKVVIEEEHNTHTYQYNNAESNLTESWEAQNIVSFATYIENEFADI